MPAFYSLGSEEEALICMTVLAEAWLAHPFAMMWLLAQRNSSPVARKRRPRGWSRKALAQLPRVAEPSPSAST
jgi:hypothetical protein